MSYRLGLNLRTTFLYFIGYDEIKDKETIFKTLHKYHHFYLELQYLLLYLKEFGLYPHELSKRLQKVESCHLYLELLCLLLCCASIERLLSIQCYLQDSVLSHLLSSQDLDHHSLFRLLHKLWRSFHLQRFQLGCPLVPAVSKELI